MTHHTGRFLVVEGMDGAGKTTLVDAIIKRLHAANREAIQVRDPGGSVLGEMFRGMIKDAKAAEKVEPVAELLGFLMTRAQMVAQVIIPAVEAGKVVVTDRFTMSTFAYQGAALGLNAHLAKSTGVDDMFMHMLQTSCTGVRAAMTVFLDIPPAVAKERLAGSKDAFDSKPLEYFEKIAGGYMRALHAKNAWLFGKVARVSAVLPISEVEQAAWQHIQTIL